MELFVALGWTGFACLFALAAWGIAASSPAARRVTYVPSSPEEFTLGRAVRAYLKAAFMLSVTGAFGCFLILMPLGGLATLVALNLAMFVAAYTEAAPKPVRVRLGRWGALALYSALLSPPAAFWVWLQASILAQRNAG